MDIPIINNSSNNNNSEASLNADDIISREYIHDNMFQCRLECKMDNSNNYINTFNQWIHSNINIHDNKYSINNNSYLYTSNSIASINLASCIIMEKTEFQSLYEIPKIPVIIHGILNEWNASKWSLKLFNDNNPLNKYKNCFFQYGVSELEGLPYKIELKYFLEYLSTNMDDSPLYLFDNAFEDDEIAKDILNDYKVPEYFNDDYFGLLGNMERPPFRWILIGPTRSGSTLHIDPLSTSAWNSLIEGYKLWILFPSTMDKSFIQLILGKLHVDKDHHDNIESSNYYVEILPKIREIIRSEGFKHNILDLGMITFIQQPGETVFIPCDCFHSVLNLTPTLAITQNYVSDINFDLVWRKTRKQRKEMAKLWLAKLKQFQPHLAQRARDMNKNDGFTEF